jgi:hypothetical protein
MIGTISLIPVLRMTGYHVQNAIDHFPEEEELRTTMATIETKLCPTHRTVKIEILAKRRI